MRLCTLFIIALCGAFGQSSSAQMNPIQTIFGQMNMLLAGPIPASDNAAFPKIKGPKSKDASIVIVGAGPSGLHMAHELVQRGYQNITIFEADSLVGGKSHSETSADDGLTHDMGTCYTNGDYTSLFQIIDELKIKVSTVPVPEGNVNYDGMPAFPYRTFLMGYFRKVWPTKQPMEAMVAFFQTMHRYMKKHQEMFGRYEGEIMPRPSEALMKTELNKTFDQFLVENDMIALRPVFKAAHSIMGYGQLDEISAIYGFMWMTPRFVLDIASRCLKIDNKMYMFVEGFQEIWNQVSAYLEIKNVNIIKSSPVVKISVISGYKFIVQSKGRNNSFDFLIWTPSIELADRTISGFGHFGHYRRFHWAASNMEPQFLTTALVNIHNATWGPINYWLSNVEGDRSIDTVWADRDSAAVKGVDLGPGYSGRTVVSYVFGPKRPTAEEVVHNFQQFYGIYNPEMRSEPHIWSYFPHFSVQEMTDGILWDLFSKQGRGNAWFIGSSVSFESVKSVMEYNNLILRNFKD